MNNDNPKFQECPPIEDLSAWYDGELADAAADRHIQRCESCRSVMQTYEAIDTAIVAGIGDDPERRVRIGRRVAAGIRRKPAIIQFYIKIGVAAGVVFLAGLVLVLQQAGETDGLKLADVSPIDAAKAAPDTPATAVESAPATAGGIVRRLNVEGGVASADAESTPEPTGPRVVNNSSELDSGESLITPAVGLAGSEVINRNAIHLTGLREFNVALKSRREENDEEDMQEWTSDVNQQNREVESHVHHVWVVQDTTEPLRVLTMFLDKEDVQVIDKMISRRSVSYQLDLRVDDRDLPGLVNHLDNRGFMLLSPSQPQPGLIKRLDFSGKTIHYKVDFVKK